MRRPRRLAPGTRWFVTFRCVRAQFRLRVDPQRREAFGFWLGYALQRFPGIQLVAAVQMSNHGHLCLVDDSGCLDQFMGLFLGNLAKALNRIDGVDGPVWQRRYAAAEILDDRALADRVAYAVTNPVNAGLVVQPDHWPGVLIRPDDRRASEFRRSWSSVDTDEDVVDVVAVLARASGEVVAHAAGLIGQRVEAIAQQRGEAPVLGARRAAEVEPFDAPGAPKKSPMPICHASSKEDWDLFRELWRAFEAAYRAASKAFRAGRLEVPFPEWTCRPSVRPL